MKVNELFYSLQGEGLRVGEPSVFIRLAGCDLACGFCDTEFASGREMTCEEILDYIKRWPAHWIVWTGGEPGLQLTDEIVAYFRKAGWLQSVETNGNHPMPPGLDWVSCSPKVAEHVLKRNFPDGVDELRYVRQAGHQGVPTPSIKAKHHYLSPMFNGATPDPASIQRCIELCLQNPSWKLSLQTHKLLRIL